MKILRMAFKREIAAPMLALVFASGISVALVLARVVWTGQLRYGFLIWNLFLAWVPLVLSLLACEQFRSETGRRWRFLSLAGAWLLFFPNAPYIFTDLIHLTSWRFPLLPGHPLADFVDSTQLTSWRFHFWIDLTLILLCALTGLVLGFLSLYLMQSLAARVFGRATGWLFVAAAAGLSSIGVYLGRFLRFNSWDVVLQPAKVYRRLDAWMDGPLASHASLGFLVLFATFLFLAYVMLYALTHLSPAPVNAEPQSADPV